MPKLRFKGFTDDWIQRKLGDWGEFYYGHSCPKWSVTEDATTPCIRYGELYTKYGAKIDRIYSYTNMPHDKLRFSKGTEVLIPRVGEDPMDYNHCTWLSLKDVAIGEMISVFNTEQNPLFTAIMFNATLQKDFAVRVEGGSVTNLYYEKLKNIDVSFPSIKEQNKIAEYISNIDRLITLHQRKCEALKEVKKYMLQKMFPKKGEKVPEIRFAGFTGDWEQRKLGELVAIGDIDHRMPKTVECGIPYLMTGDFCGINELNFEGVKHISEDDYEQLSRKIKPEKHDILFARYASVGAVRYVEFTDKFLISYSCAIIKNGDKIDSKYLYHFLTSDIAQKQIALEINTGSQANIGIDSMKNNILVHMPCVEEQHIVASYFDSLDKLIALHQRKHETLKEIKKYMLQNMFPKK